MERSDNKKDTDVQLKALHSLFLIIAVIVAVTCNDQGEQVKPVLMALFFPEIYLLQRLARIYVTRESNYGWKRPSEIKADSLKLEDKAQS